MPASKDPPAFGLPLEYTIDVPEVPSEIAAPSVAPHPPQEEKKRH